MGRQPCCEKVGLKKGPWTAEEDKKLISFILTHGHCCWRAVPKLAGLLRCGKSCRLRWTNYLRPDLKRGLLSESEEKLVIHLHSQLGNRWSKIASQLPGRTDNEIKNHWSTHIKKKLRKMGIDPLTHKPIPSIHHQQDHQQQQQQQQDPLNDTERPYEQANSQYPPTVPREEEDDKSTTTRPSDCMEADVILRKSPGFCTDEVPMVHPHETVVPCDSSSSSTSSSSFSVGGGEIQVPLMELPESTMYFSGLDDIVEWDLSNDRSDPELNPDPFFTRYERIFTDEESSWELEFI